MSLSNKIQKQTEEIRQCAAEALGYHTAGLHNRLPQTLISLMKKVARCPKWASFRIKPH